MAESRSLAQMTLAFFPSIPIEKISAEMVQCVGIFIIKLDGLFELLFGTFTIIQSVREELAIKLMCKTAIWPYSDGGFMLNFCGIVVFKLLQ